MDSQVLNLIWKIFRSLSEVTLCTLINLHIQYINCMASIHIHISHIACKACYIIYITYIHRTCTMDAQIRINYGFPHSYSNSLEYIKDLCFIFIALPNLNSSSLHVTTLVIQDYKDPLAYQGKLFTLHCFVTNN